MEDEGHTQIKQWAPDIPPVDGRFLNAWGRRGGHSEKSLLWNNRGETAGTGALSHGYRSSDGSREGDGWGGRKIKEGPCFTPLPRTLRPRLRCLLCPQTCQPPSQELRVACTMPLAWTALTPAAAFETHPWILRSPASHHLTETQFKAVGGGSAVSS